MPAKAKSAAALAKELADAEAAAAAASLAAGLYPRTNVYEYSSGVAPQIPRWPMCAKWPKIHL